MGTDFHGIYTYAQDRLKLISGESTVSNLLEASRRNINNHNHLNAFVEVYERDIRSYALDLNNKHNRIDDLPLYGLIVASKDNIAVMGKHVTCASNVLKGYTAPEDATAIKRLKKVGAIVIGRTNMDEFGMGSSSEHSIYGVVHHPQNETLVAGGSSGGSAVVVATGMAHVALGSDTGGSVRQPAAFNGIFGFKPTYGRISRNGLVAFSSSCDQIGIFARCVDDIEAVFKVASGKDEKDASTVDYQPSHSETSLETIRVGLPKEFFPEELDKDIKTCLEDAINMLKQSKVAVETVSLPTTKYAVAANYIIANAEAATNLARYDGVRFSTRPGNFNDINELYASVRTDGFGDEVKRRILLGMSLTTGERFETRYKKALKVRRLIQQDMERVFNNVDVLLTPVTAETVFKLGEKQRDLLKMYLSDSFTTPANMAGIPAISIPAGKDSNGLPIGIQLMAKAFDDEKLFSVAKQVHRIIQKKLQK